MRVFLLFPSCWLHHTSLVIESIQFRHFKALRAASLKLRPFNLIIGPNGSGKTSLIQAIQRLRQLSQLPLSEPGTEPPTNGQVHPELVFRFPPPNQGSEARLSCRSGMHCDRLQLSHISSDNWEVLRHNLLSMRVYMFDHYAMAMPCAAEDSSGLASNGGNIAAVYHVLKRFDPGAFSLLQDEVVRLLPEFSALEVRDAGAGRVELGLVLAEDGEFIPADGLSQGVLYLLGYVALAYDPHPPALVCIEDLDRGIHPRKLRELRDLLYRLSHPAACGLKRPACQVIATTHSPYLLDQFRDHPEEVVIAQKQGRSADFMCLSDRPDLAELLQEGSLGDLWYSGILGGVPEEPEPGLKARTSSPKA